MTRALTLATLALAGCAKLSIDQLIGMVPTPAEICAMSPETQAALAATMRTDVASLTAACEIVGK